MNPAPALGTFLKHWRSQWAGLTQAQLAMAVGAASGGRRITERVVRRWEEGQPPADTEELEGLLVVMRRHGLTEPEIGHVRRAIFAACLDRHYPELFASEEFAELPDVDEEAREECLRVMSGFGAQDIVGLVARQDELARAGRERLTPAGRGTHARRQDAAQAYLGIALAYQHFGRGRSALAAARCDAAADLVTTHFGEALEPMFSAHNLADRALIFGFKAAPSATAIRALLAAAEAARARGDDPWGGSLLCEAACYCGQFGDAALRAEVRSAARDRIAICREHGSPVTLGQAHRSEFWMACADRRLAEAEHHLALYDQYAPSDILHEVALGLCRGKLALAADTPGEAEELFEAALPLARRLGYGYYERLLAAHLQRLRGGRRVPS